MSNTPENIPNQEPTEQRTDEIAINSKSSSNGSRDIGAIDNQDSPGGDGDEETENLGSDATTQRQVSPPSDKKVWDNFWSHVIEVASLVTAIAALFLAWFAFKVPLDTANKNQEREQATKIAVSVENYQCSAKSDDKSNPCYNREPGEIFWESNVINSSDAPIYNVIARVTPKKYANTGAALGSFESESGYQVLPNDKLAIGSGYSSFNDHGSELVKYSVAYAFTDAEGKRWYNSYDVDTTSADVESLYTVTNKLTDVRPEDWPLAENK